MSVLLSDTGSGSGNLDVSQVGGRKFVQFPALAFTRSGGLFVTSQALTANPMALLDAGCGDIDASLNVNGSGGDCLYFRVKDASNWLRLRVHSWQSDTGTSTTWDGTYAIGNWAYQYTQCFAPGDGGYTVGTTYYSVSSNAVAAGVYDQYISDGGASCNYGEGITGHSGQVYSRTVTKNMTTISYPIYSYETVLEKCVGGVVTTVTTYAGQPTTLRVVDNRTTITPYINGTAKTAVTLQTASGGTMAGFGKGGPTTLTGSALKNFSLKVVKAGWGGLA